MSRRMPDLPRRRQGDRIGGILLAALGIVVAVVAVVALRHPNGRQANAVSPNSTTTVTNTATRTARPSPSKSPRPSGSRTAASHPIPLIVLNNTTQQNLAATAQQRFVAGGWTVSSTGNLNNDILSTCAYYDPTDPANQQAALALQQQFPSIKRVKERFPQLPAGPIVVVLTSDFS